jgi:hypothetical protein
MYILLMDVILKIILLIHIHNRKIPGEPGLCVVSAGLTFFRRAPIG